MHYLQKGIPELDIYEVSPDGNYPITVLAMNLFLFTFPQIEPVVIDEIGIVLGSGPDGYRALFRNIQAYGVSNITVTNVRYVFTWIYSSWVGYFTRAPETFGVSPGHISCTMITMLNNNTPFEPSKLSALVVYLLQILYIAEKIYVFRQFL